MAIFPPPPKLGPLLAAMLAKRDGGEAAVRPEPPASVSAAGRSDALDAHAGDERNFQDGTTAGADGTAEAAAPIASLAGGARAALVFVESAEEAEQLRRALKNKRISAAAIHTADGNVRAPPVPARLRDPTRRILSGERMCWFTVP